MKYLLFVLVLMSLFGAAAGQNVPVDLQAAKGYMLGPGDVVKGVVSGDEQYNFTATVDEDGKIAVPFAVEPIMAKCRTEMELRSQVIVLLAKYLRNPQISIQATERKVAPVTVYGEVYRPEQFILGRKKSLGEVIAFAGGAKEEAGGLVQVFRTQPPMCTDPADESNWKANVNDPTDVPSRSFSLAEIKMGKMEANPTIYPGDVVVVQKAAPVYITGEVVAPQGIYLKEEGLSLTEAIAKIGGVRREAKTKDIKIYRLKANSKDREVISANYDLIKKGTQKDIVLQPYDIIEVDKAKDSILTAVFKLAIGASKTIITSGASSAGYRVLY